MPPLRFLHTSDLHLGKRFGRFDEETRATLQQARQELPARLAEIARAEAATHVLLAGDTFDTETPSPRIWRQALAVMREAADLQWWIIPGNHDSGAAEGLWQQFQTAAPENVHLLMEAVPQQMAPGVSLLPAPCLHRFSGQDLTAWMDGCDTPDGDIRIGLAHGGVLEFSAGADRGDEGAEVISPDRAERAGLDYLALGDWHGAFTLNARMRYPGAPEADRFKHAGRGLALLVEIAAAGQPVQVREVAVGRLHWQEIVLDLTPEEDAVQRLHEHLPPDRAGWVTHLVKLRLRGWVTAPARLRLQDAANGLAPEFCHFELDLSDLATQHQADDLDLIAKSGALRVAADDLAQEATEVSLAQRERDIAAAALDRMFAFSINVADAGPEA